uniref:Zinc finger C3HC4 RING-type domain-containing protein n=1 Tax=Anopheles atroparvus TaxID=41427 RepID=A0AAG5DQP9_ANOAO
MIPICSICNRWLIGKVTAIYCGHVFHEDCLERVIENPIPPCGTSKDPNVETCQERWTATSGLRLRTFRRLFLHVDTNEHPKTKEIHRLLEEIEQVEKELRSLQPLHQSGRCKCRQTREVRVAAKRKLSSEEV